MIKPFLAALTVALLSCAKPEGDARRATAADDSAFADVQRRGAVAMGVDQFTSTHHFTPNDSGGLIELQRDSTDSAGTTQIRAHMRHIATAFAAGDFTLPGLVHDTVVPGTETMRSRRGEIAYSVEDLPRGAQVRLVTADTVARRAIHEFLAFQRQDHHAGARH
jgi:hypothetical protein